MDLLVEGQKLTLFFSKDDNMVEMSCNIEKLYDDRLDLQLPQYFMRYIQFLQVGKKLTAKVFTSVGTIDFNTVVIHSPLEETFTIELDYNSMKFNSNDTMSVIRDMRTVEISFENENLTVKSFEISNEYIKIYSDRTFMIDTVLTGMLFLPKDYGIIKFKAVVTEKDSVYDNEYKLDYITMTENDKQSLLYYMYMYSKDNNNWMG